MAATRHITELLFDAQARKQMASECVRRFVECYSVTCYCKKIANVINLLLSRHRKTCCGKKLEVQPTVWKRIQNFKRAGSSYSGNYYDLYKYIFSCYSSRQVELNSVNSARLYFFCPTEIERYTGVIKVMDPIWPNYHRVPVDLVEAVEIIYSTPTVEEYWDKCYKKGFFERRDHCLKFIAGLCRNAIIGFH